MRAVEAAKAAGLPGPLEPCANPGKTAPEPIPRHLCLIVMETPNAPNFEAAAAVTDTPSDVSQRLANLLGGDVSVSSNPGEGSVFTVRLPRRVPKIARIPERALRAG